MFLIDKKGKKAISLKKKTFSDLNLTERYDLQEWIVDNPNILGEHLLIIQKEFSDFSETNERLDLLALDEDGKLVIIENKLDDSGKDVVWQALKYVSYCATLGKTEIYEIYQKYLGETMNAQKNITDFYDTQDFEEIKLNSTEGDQRIILVAANFRKEVTSTVLWLSDYHGVDIKCIKVTPYEDDDKLYLDVEQIIPIQDIGDYQIRLTAKKQEDNISAKEDATRYKTRYLFWEKALPVLRERTDFYNHVSPTKDNWIAGSFGYSGLGFNSVILMNEARAELYIGTVDKDRNKSIFDNLKKVKSEIKESISGQLDWQELPGKTASRICLHYNEYGLRDEDNWDDIIDFLTNSIDELSKAFKPLLDKILSR